MKTYKKTRKHIHPWLREWAVDHKNRIAGIVKPPRHSNSYWRGYRRPRPLLGPFHGVNGDYYIRNQSLTYWQLKQKLQLKRRWWEHIKYHHIFQKRHHLKYDPVIEDKLDFINAGFWIAVGVGFFTFYTIILLRAFL